jgi:predicted secreted protein
MATIEEIAAAALQRDGLQLRHLTQEYLRSNPTLADTPRPQTTDEHTLSISAALLELFALRTNQRPPSWVADVGPVKEPFFLVNAAVHMKRLRELCLTESPEPLRSRHFYAPSNYLTFA